MNITSIYSLINLIKMENYVQKIIKGPAKLSVTHWWKVIANIACHSQKLQLIRFIYKLRRIFFLTYALTL